MSAPHLGTREVHVWRYVVNGCADEAVLSPDERARSDRLREPRRREFVFGRASLRLVLGTYLGAHPATVPIADSPSGKPELAPGSSFEWLRFNLSHAAELLLIAVARGRDVGVDVERVVRERALSPIAEQLFSARESAALRSLPRPWQTRAFFSLWTRKEAYVKATGVGMGVPLEDVDVLSLPGGWSVHDLPVAPGYAAAVAVEGSVSEIRLLAGDQRQVVRDRSRIASRHLPCAIDRHVGRHDRQVERQTL